MWKTSYLQHKGWWQWHDCWIQKSLLHMAQRGGGNRTESHYVTLPQSTVRARVGPRNHNAETGYTTASKAQDIKKPHDLTVCVCAWERKTRTRQIVSADGVHTVTSLRFTNIWLYNNKACVSKVSVYSLLVKKISWKHFPGSEAATPWSYITLLYIKKMKP